MGQFPTVHTTGDFKSAPLKWSMEYCNDRCTSKIRGRDKNNEAKEMDRLIQVT